MHFLFALYKYFPSGGLQKDTLRFAEEAVTRGHQVTLFTTSWEGETPRQGITLHICPVKGWSNHRKMDHFAKQFALFQQEHPFDATLAMNRIPGADFYFVADSCMARWMPQKHSRLALMLLPRYRIYLRHEADICAPQSKTRLLYIAPPQKKEFQQCYHLPEERLLYLPPGMDPRCGKTLNGAQIRQDIRKQYEIEEDELLLVEIGTNLWRKGVDRTLLGLRFLLENGIKARLMLAGGDSPSDVSSLAKRQGISSRHLLFLGPRNDVPSLLLASDLMVHPAREEGTGTVLIEAIASGLPVICTETCGFSNFVQEATQTVIPEPFSQESLNTTLLSASRNLPQLASQTAAYAPTQDFYGRSKVAIDYLESVRQHR